MTFQIAIGSNIRKSPFFDATVADGVQSFSIYNHMLMPDDFGDPAAEYHRLLNGVVMWDVAGERQVELSGPDAGALAQYLTPRNIAGTKIGQGRYVPLCNAAGQVINDPVLLKLSETRYWLSVADCDVHLWAAAIAHERSWDVAVHEPDVSPLAVQGPKAEDVIASLFGDWVRDLRYFWFRETQLHGIPLVLARSGWSKQGGFELYLMDSADGTRLWQIVKDAGAAFGIGPGAPNNLERIESGLLSYGADFRLQTHAATPYELGFGAMMDLDGHDFIGRAALREIAKTPPARRWTGFILGGAPVAPVGHPIDLTQNGAPAGYLSEVIYSHRLGQSIGIGMARSDLDQNTEGLTAALPGDPRPARITAVPFVK